MSVINHVYEMFYRRQCINQHYARQHENAGNMETLHDIAKNNWMQ